MSKASGSIDLKSLKVAGEGASKYITEITSDGIFISPSSQNPAESAEGNSIKINGSGMEVYKGGVSVAQYGDTARIGRANNSAFYINSNSLQAYYMNGTTRTLYFEVSPTGIKFGTDLGSTVATTSQIPTTVASLSDASSYALKTYADNKASAAQTAATNAAATDATNKANEAATKATNYITHVDSAGITIHPSGTTNDRIALNASGLEIYKGNVSVAKYGDTARIGKETGTNTNLVATSSGINFRSGTTQFGQLSAYDSTILGTTSQNLSLVSKPSANSYGGIILSASSASGAGVSSEASLVAKKGSGEAGVYVAADQDSGGGHADVIIAGQNIALQVGHGDDYINVTSSNGSVATLDVLGNLDITGNANITGNAFENEKRLISRNFICYANSIVRSFSSGSITMSLADLGITTGQKPVGILLTYQDGGATPTILRYDYDASSSSGVVIKAYDSSGKAVSGNVRFFALVFQNSWTSVV